MPHSVSPDLPASLLRTLRMAAEALAATQDAWWVIGGAAIGLHGVLTTDVPDVDVIMSTRDARHVALSLNLPHSQDGGTGLFRSEIFARWTSLPLTVDLMGGFQTWTRGAWKRLEPATREPVPIGGQILYIPSRRELIDICRLFGRPKDMARAAALADLERQTSPRVQDE
jgi:hypothetical protein